MAQTGNKKELLLRFTVGGKDYQISAAEVERVLSLQRQAISPIPFDLGGRILGLFSFRGAVLPLARITDVPIDKYAENTAVTVILLGTGDKRFGIAVDRACEISDEVYPDSVFVSAGSLYEGSADSV